MIATDCNLILNFFLLPNSRLKLSAPKGQAYKAMKGHKDVIFTCIHSV